MQGNAPLHTRGSTSRPTGLLAFTCEMETIHSFHLSLTHRLYECSTPVSDCLKPRGCTEQRGELHCCVVPVAWQPCPFWKRKVGWKTTGKKIGGRQKEKYKKGAKKIKQVQGIVRHWCYCCYLSNSLDLSEYQHSQMTNVNMWGFWGFFFQLFVSGTRKQDVTLTLDFI